MSTLKTVEGVSKLVKIKTNLSPLENIFLFGTLKKNYIGT